MGILLKILELKGSEFFQLNNILVENFGLVINLLLVDIAYDAIFYDRVLGLELLEVVGGDGMPGDIDVFVQIGLLVEAEP